MRLFISMLLLLAAAAPANAQEDAFHTWLAAHLESDYGLTGLEWVLSDSESGTLALASPSGGVVSQSVTPFDQPFSRAVRYIVSQPADNPWDRTVRFDIQEPVARGDALLLVVWLRHSWPAGELPLVQPLFERASEPYDKSFEAAYEFPSGEWVPFMIPFEANDDYGPNQARIQFNMGFRRQMIDLGGLALINFGSGRAVSELPSVLPPITYEGQDASAPWRSEAAARIETHRKADLLVRVEDAAGNPVQDAPVQVRMKRHAFGFGSAVSTYAYLNGPATFRNRLADLTGDGRTFSIAVLENALKWGAWEANWPGSKGAKVELVSWLRDQGMEVRGHNLVWPGWQYLPSDLEQNQGNLSYIQDRLRARILEMAGYPGLKGVLRDWDVINEAAHVKDLENLFAGTPGYTDGTELYTEWFKLAEQADPDAVLYFNEYQVLSGYGGSDGPREHLKELITGLQADGARVDGIGIQGHMGTPLMPPDSMYRVLEDMAQFGTRLAITEYDLVGVSGEPAADYLRDFLTVVFSHPSVESFLMWGFWDGAHFANDAPLFEEDWTLKPSGQAFMDLVFDEWWTDASATTGADGTALVRGFKGDYEVVATVGGSPVSQEVQLSGDSTVDVTLVATSVHDGARPLEPGLGTPYPNPATGRITIPFVADASAPATIQVYDLLGRRVLEHAPAFGMAGPQEAVIEFDSLPAGLYLLRLQLGSSLWSSPITILN